MVKKRTTNIGYRVDGSWGPLEAAPDRVPATVWPVPRAQAARILAAREAAGLSSLDLALAVGVSQTAVWLWEHGRTRQLKRDHLRAVARVLQQSPAWLETGQPPRKEEPHHEMPHLPATSKSRPHRKRSVVHTRRHP